jgi:hypothetical protein
MKMIFDVEVDNNVRRKKQYHLENFHASPAHPFDISSGEIVAL